MNETKIAWTQHTWNAVSGCSKVSDGCKFCYAATLSQKYGWTSKPWTIQNEADNVKMKPHKLHEPYKLPKESARVFTNSMSDMFHRSIPDWYIAVMFCVMLDTPHLTYQILTKRPERAIDWHERFLTGMKSDPFLAFSKAVKDKRVKAALEREWDSPWGDNIWMGTSVEDSRVLHRIESLKQSKARTRFISAEPLLGAWGQVDLSGVHWVIVGGESGLHMKDNPDRWMQMEWAREIRDLCVAQEIAYFFKQDSGYRTELRPYLVEGDGSRWQWYQYPDDRAPAKNIDTGELKYMPKPFDGVDYDMPWDEYVALVAPSLPATKPTTVVNFRDVKDHWNRETQAWDDSRFVYIGRANGFYGVPQSPWGNPYSTVGEYREFITGQLAHQPWLRQQLETLRGKTLVCWCKKADRHIPCHGDVLLEILGEAPAKPEVQPAEQLTLF